MLFFNFQSEKRHFTNRNFIKMPFFRGKSEIHLWKKSGYRQNLDESSSENHKNPTLFGLRSEAKMPRRRGMSDFESFTAALEKTLEKTIRESFSNEKEAPISAGTESTYLHLAWLMGQTKIVKPTKAYQQSPYTRFKQPPKPRPEHKFSPAQKSAYEEIMKYSPSLKANFNSQELKKAYRAALMATHPDRGGNALAFWKVQEAHSILGALTAKV